MLIENGRKHLGSLDIFHLTDDFRFMAIKAAPIFMKPVMKIVKKIIFLVRAQRKIEREHHAANLRLLGLHVDDRHFAVVEVCFNISLQRRKAGNENMLPFIRIPSMRERRLQEQHCLLAIRMRSDIRSYPVSLFIAQSEQCAPCRLARSVELPEERFGGRKNIEVLDWDALHYMCPPGLQDSEHRAQISPDSPHRYLLPGGRRPHRRPTEDVYLQRTNS